MSKIKKTWVEKRDCDKEPLVKINPKSWSDMPKGIKMFIPTPKIVNQFVCNIPKGNFKNVKSLRRDMAVDFDAQMSCPMVTIFVNPKCNFEQSCEKKWAIRFVFCRCFFTHSQFLSNSKYFWICFAIITRY